VTSQKPLIRIVGGGFSGLTLAYFLSERFRVEVFEASTRAGGMLGTSRSERALTESAANALLNSALLEEIASKISVELLPTHKKSRKRYIYVDGKARRWPLRLWESLRLLGRIPFLKQNPPRKGESLALWAERSLGKAATAKLLAPALQGIYAGRIEEMSASLVMQRFFGTFKASGAPKGKRGSVAPRGGMEDFTEGLKSYLEKQGVRFHFAEKLEADRLPALAAEYPLLLAVNMHAAAELLRQVDPEASLSLARLEMLPLTSCTLVARQEPGLLEGFGVLFEKSEGFRALGVLFNHDIFPGRVSQQDLRSETWIVPGSPKSERELRELIEKDQERLHGRKLEWLEFKVRVWEKALPHYSLELEEWLDAPHRERLALRGLYLAGNFTGNLGLTRILNANKELADRITARHG
jgi:oxygen-dependent protoporphyrinogen oxidase